MFKSQTSGTITFNSDTLAKKIALSANTLKKYEQILQEKKLLELVPYKKDNATGAPVQARVYDFEQWSNLIALKFTEQDERLDSHEHELKRMQQRIEMLEKELLKRDLKDKAEEVHPITL